MQWARDSRSVAFASSTHLLTDQYRAGFVLDLDTAGKPVGAPRVVTPLALGPNALIWGPPVLDTVAPTASATLDKPANGQGWHRESVVAKLRAEDDEGGDGVASVTYTVDGKKTTATGAAKDVVLSADGVHTLAYFATDKAGNASAAKSLVVRVDRTPPAVAIGSPGAGAAHVVGTSVTAAYSCSDGGSGVVGCDGSTPAGGALDTGAPGARTLKVTARDRAGNTATVGPCVERGGRAAARGRGRAEARRGATRRDAALHAPLREPPPLPDPARPPDGRPAALRRGVHRQQARAAHQGQQAHDPDRPARPAEGQVQGPRRRDDPLGAQALDQADLQDLRAQAAALSNSALTMGRAQPARARAAWRMRWSRSATFVARWAASA